jgi:hypothetical protein
MEAHHLTDSMSAAGNRAPRLDGCFPNKLRILFQKLAFNARE